MSRSGFLIDDRFRRHDPGSRHVESPRRLVEIQQAVDSSGIARRWQRIQPRPARMEELALIHSREHIERIRQASQRAPSCLDSDTWVSADSYTTAVLAAGGVLACVDDICNGKIDRAFAFVRPPGHHAGPNRAMGFCLFNNVAIAAAFLRNEYGLDRVAIVDFDVHHGNGTQACFYDSPHVLFVSTHRYPFYPGTGDFSEVGSGEGWGYTVNFPLPAGTGDGVFVPIFARIVPAILDQYKPQFILISAGFDALLGDPLGGLAVSVAGFASAASSLLKSADICCGGRACFVLEGGYSPSGLQECTMAVLAEMESAAPKQAPFPVDPLFEVISDEARELLRNQWKW